jgi:hypothetical protein
LQGGTWTAGRKIAAEKRPGGRRPSPSRPTARCSRVLRGNCNDVSELVHVVGHPLVQHKLTLMRRKETPTAEFRRLLREIAMLLAYEVTRDLPLTTERIETPVAPMQAPVLEGKKLCVVSILRAGNGLLDGFLDLIPSPASAISGSTATRRPWCRSSTI